MKTENKCMDSILIDLNFAGVHIDMVSDKGGRTKWDSRNNCEYKEDKICCPMRESVAFSMICTWFFLCLGEHLVIK